MAEDDVSDRLQPYKKKDRPAYEKQEKRFAKQHGFRQTVSSGRIGFVKGDSYDREFAVDNKGTQGWTFIVDVRKWMALRKRALLSGRDATLEVTFGRSEIRPPESITILSTTAWLAMRQENNRLRTELSSARKR